MVKLIDLRSTTNYNVQFGTCDICMRTGILEQEWLVFEDHNGNTFEIETGEWDWGDYNINYEIDNLAEFCEFILSKKIPDFKVLVNEFESLYDEYTNTRGNGE